MGSWRDYFSGLKRPSQITWLFIIGLTLLLVGGISTNLPAGRYTLLTGLYDPLAGRRLLLQDGSGQDVIVLGEVVMERP